MEKNNISIAKPFGPTIAKVTIPEDMILKLNNYIDEVIKDEEKIKLQDHGKNLAGQVTQEFVLDNKFSESSKLALLTVNDNEIRIRNLKC